MTDPQLDARLRQLRGLLDSMLTETPDASGGEGSHWRLPPPPLDLDGQLSSTDILSWWFQAPNAGPDPWGEYFGEGGTTGSSPKDAAPTAPSPTAAAEPPIDARVALSLFFDKEDDSLPDEHAQAAVDCLFDFLRSVANRDMGGAMNTIANDYHAMEEDREVDALALRQGLESFLDSVRGWDLDVSLAEAPRPIGHPLGVLIPVDIQMDAIHPESGKTSCRVERRVAVLWQDAAGEWKIHSLSTVPR